MSSGDSDFRIRPGRGRDAGRGSGGKGQRLAAQVRRAAARQGLTPLRKGGRGGTQRLGRGRRAVAVARFRANGRRVVVKARVVRHKGMRYRAAPLAKHISYLERDGVARDGREASLFDAEGDAADRSAFAARCDGDRHHFRFIVSPEDAGAMDDLRGFTRDLMKDMSRDLGTGLDWVAIDHWNTDNPHIHILVRGVADDGTDLVIDRAYVSEGIRFRAEERVTLELGLRSEREMTQAIEREVDAERWTSLDRQIERATAESGGLLDLRPAPDGDQASDRMLRGRAATLERLGLAECLGPAIWMVDPGAERALRDLAERGDIIKTMHRAMQRSGMAFDTSALALHRETPPDPIVGRLVARGLDDEIDGSAFAIVDGVDGRTHHIRFDDIEWTGDAKSGAIVELRSWEGRGGTSRLSLAVRSDLPLGEQIGANGATWLDRQLVARDTALAGSGFGLAVRDAMAARATFLEGEGLARRQGQRLVMASGLIDTLKQRDLDAAQSAIAARTGLAHQPSANGEHVSGIYRERVSLASGRFAMIDDGLGFQLVPWRPALDRHLGQHVAGTMASGGSIDWSLGRGRGIGI
ncbi:relaxase/mobilization nuclease domain-containing protein [Sphingopyxis sp. LARHCG72]